MWVGWNFLQTPPHIFVELQNLQNNILGSTPIGHNSIDGYRWDPTGMAFSMKLAYQTICKDLLPAPIWSNWKEFWKIEAIPKIKFFSWLLLKGKILTSDNLKKRGFIVPSICPNFHKDEETILHLFISCPFSIQCWTALTEFAQLNWTSLYSLVDFLIS